MSLYSRHRIPRENKPHVDKNAQWLYRLSHSRHVPEEKRGFWYKGVQKALTPFYWEYQREVFREFAKSMVVQIYNQSPLITELLSNATVDM